MATISDLQPFLANRVEEVPSDTIFWQTETELNSALMESMCEALLLVGRPDLIVNVPFSIVPNTPWQQVSKGMFCILNIQGPASEVWKVTLEDLDYSQISDSGWEQDIGDSILKWAPIGMNQFVVWPSVAQAQTVLMTGIASPITGIWPYTGAEAVPFQDSFFVSLEKYAASYLRLKELGAEHAEGVKLYQDFLQDMKRMTQLQDRIDPFLWEGSTGSKLVANPTISR